MNKTIAIYLVNQCVRGWNACDENILQLERSLPGFTLCNAKNQEEFLQFLKVASIAITWSFRSEWLEEFPNIKVIGTPAAGADYLPNNVDNDITIIRGEFHGDTMSETVIGMMLDHVRRIQEASYRMNNGESWPRDKLDHTLRRLTGSHVAILGFGSIGMVTARRLKAFDCKITGIKRTVNCKPIFFQDKDRVITIGDFHEVLPTVDHLISFLPDNSETDDLVDMNVFDLLPTHAGFYSLGRGNSTSEVDLLKALADRSISGAYLDVFKDEPLPSDSPLRGVDNLYLMPHASAVSPQYMELFFDELPSKILKLF